MDEIRFNKPSLHGREVAYIQQAVNDGHTSMKGRFTKLVADLLREESGAEDVLLTTSCTDALEMSAMLLDLRPGDVVIVPSFTFVSTALAFVREGASLLFCDIEPVTLGLDPAHLRTLLGPRVRAVVTVHYAGVGCDLDGIRRVLADWPDVVLVEDNAHGLFGRYRGRPLGSYGRFSTLSFHETKNFICGEGGALVLNDVADVERAHIMLDKGTNRRQFMLGQVDKYSWQGTGSSFGLSDLLAAYLWGQLEAREEILGLRRGVWERYEDGLVVHADRLGVGLPVVPDDRDQAFHMFYVLLPDRRTRDAVLGSMAADGVHPTFHYVPLHTSPGGTRYAAEPTECPVTDDVSGRLLRLPFFNTLGAETQGVVIESFVRAVESASG